MLTYTGSLWLVDLSVCMYYKHYIKCFCWFRHLNWMWHDLGSQCRVRIQCQIQICSLYTDQYTWLTEYWVWSQSNTQTTVPVKLSWGTSEASFINTLPCIKRVLLWHTAQGRCDHGDIVPQYSLINKNSLISFSVYLKQFDMNTKKKEIGLNSPKWVVAPLIWY